MFIGKHPNTKDMPRKCFFSTFCNVFDTRTVKGVGSPPVVAGRRLRGYLGIPPLLFALACEKSPALSALADRCSLNGLGSRCACLLLGVVPQRPIQLRSSCSPAVRAAICKALA